MENKQKDQEIRTHTFVSMSRNEAGCPSVFRGSTQVMFCAHLTWTGTTFKAISTIQYLDCVLKAGATATGSICLCVCVAPNSFVLAFNRPFVCLCLPAVSHVVVPVGHLPTTSSTLLGLLAGCWVVKFSCE